MHLWSVALSRIDSQVLTADEKSAHTREKDKYNDFNKHIFEKMY